MTAHRLVTGTGPCPNGAILDLAAHIGRAAVARGFTFTALRRSHNPTSSSRYVWLRDRGGREWLIRVSNHHMPRITRQPVPNFNLVSLDGASGLPEALSFLDRAFAGAADWHDPRDTAVRAEFRQRGKRRRCK